MARGRHNAIRLNVLFRAHSRAPGKMSYLHKNDTGSFGEHRQLLAHSMSGTHREWANVPNHASHWQVTPRKSVLVLFLWCSQILTSWDKLCSVMTPTAVPPYKQYLDAEGNWGIVNSSKLQCDLNLWKCPFVVNT